MKAVWKWTREGNVELNKRKEIKQFSNFESSVKGNFVLVIKGIMSWIHNLKCSLHTLKHKPNTINVLLIKLLSTNLVPYNITKKSWNEGESKRFTITIKSYAFRWVHCMDQSTPLQGLSILLMRLRNDDVQCIKILHIILLELRKFTFSSHILSLHQWILL